MSEIEGLHYSGQRRLQDEDALQLGARKKPCVHVICLSAYVTIVP